MGNVCDTSPGLEVNDILPAFQVYPVMSTSCEMMEKRHMKLGTWGEAPGIILKAFSLVAKKVSKPSVCSFRGFWLIPVVFIGYKRPTVFTKSYHFNLPRLVFKTDSYVTVS